MVDRATRVAVAGAGLVVEKEDAFQREIAAGETELAAEIKDSSLKLIRESGFAEYYDPLTGDPLGGARFTWTAAMVIEFMEEY